jgi:glyoxylase-like metal-dependent hydrolase (beta-lactamase superfamily II)
MTDVLTLDVHYQGRLQVVACYLVPTGDGGFALIECGPANSLPTLERAVEEAGYALRDLRALLLTHIHLDHAGAAGSLARRSGCRVWVHPVGLPHLADPEARLLPSARRLYGEAMEALWGVMEAVPASQLQAVQHGQRVRAGDLEAVAWHTPGHARHHVCWQVGDDVATGDVAGVRFPGSSYVLPPTPPPDIDLEAWRSSLDLLRDLEVRRLLLAHFGAIGDVARHLDELQGRLGRWQELARAVIERGGGGGELERELTALDDTELSRAGVPAEARHEYRRLCSMEDAAAGLLRAVGRG